MVNGLLPPLCPPHPNMRDCAALTQSASDPALTQAASASTQDTVGLFEEPNDESNGIDDGEVEAGVAADSGACAHVVGPNDIPGNVKTRQVIKRRFHGANNSSIEHCGEAVVQLVQGDGTVATSTVHVAEVCRPLHAVSVICDGPPGGENKKELLYTDTEAVVVPGSSLSKFLAGCKRLAMYPRVGGLYVAKVKVRNPPSSAAVKSEDFTRPSRGR